MKNLLKEKLVRVWQFIKAQIESYRTTIFANKIKPECDKIEVVFVVYFSEAFSSFQALYEMLRCDDSFSVHILCQPSLKSLDKNDSYLFLSEYYAGVINAYENSKWYDLKKLAPDYMESGLKYIANSMGDTTVLKMEVKEMTGKAKK